MAHQVTLSLCLESTWEGQWLTPSWITSNSEHEVSLGCDQMSQSSPACLSDSCNLTTDQFLPQPWSPTPTAFEEGLSLWFWDFW